MPVLHVVAEVGGVKALVQHARVLLEAQVEPSVGQRHTHAPEPSRVTVAIIVAVAVAVACAIVAHVKSETLRVAAPFTHVHSCRRSR